MNKTIKIGTRGSQLALWQANHISREIARKNPSVSVDLVIIKTKGDKITDVPLAKVGGKGLFVKEIEEALLDGRADIAVHSMKDMPADIPAGLCIGAVPEREDARDVLISGGGFSLMGLPFASCIGTSSLRRAAQLRHLRRDFDIVPLRGNLDTRISKLDAGNFDAIVLAAAGVRRLNLESRITEYIDETVMLPAVGQGALCIEIRENDPEVHAIVSELDDSSTRTVVMGERAFLNRLEGGCQVPIAAHGRLEKGVFALSALICDSDGTGMIRGSLSGPESRSEQIGLELAEQFLSKGAKPVLEKLKAEQLSVNQ